MRMPFLRPKIGHFSYSLILLICSLFIFAVLLPVVPAQAFPESTMYAVEMTDELQKAHEYIDKSEYGKSIEIYKRVLGDFKARGDEKGVLFSLERIGWLLRREGKPDEARAYFLKAYPIGVKLNGNAAEIESDLGAVYFDKGEKSKAVRHFNKALRDLKGFEFPTTYFFPLSRAQVAKYTRKSTAIINARVLLAAIHMSAKQNGKALQQLNITLKLINDLFYVGTHPIYAIFYEPGRDIYEGMGYVHTYLGAVWKAMKQTEKARSHFNSGRNAFLKIQDHAGLKLNNELSSRIEKAAK